MKKTIMTVLTLGILFAGCDSKNDSKYFFSVDSIKGFTIKLKEDKTIELYKDKYARLPIIVKPDEVEQIGYRANAIEYTITNTSTGRESNNYASVILIKLKNGETFWLALQQEDRNIIDILRNQGFKTTDNIDKAEETK